MARVLGRVRAGASRGSCFAIAFGLAWAAGHVPTVQAAAHVPPPEVRWNAPAECPADAFTAALARLLEGSPIDTPIRVDATVEHTADGWSIQTDFDAGPERAGQRSFQAATCRTVSQASALVIAIAVDPGVLDRWVPLADAAPEPVAPQVSEPRAPAERGPDPAEPSEPPPELGPIEAAAPTSVAGERARHEPASRWRGLVGAGGLVDGGAVPCPGLGVAGVLGAVYPGFRAELVGGYRFATRRAATDDSRVGGAFTQWWVGARGCGVPRVRAVELPLCAGLEGGQTVGRGLGLRESRITSQPWWAAVVEAGVAWPVRPWLALTARATLAVPLLRQAFTIEGLGLVHRVGPVHGRGALGVELRWP